MSHYETLGLTKTATKEEIKKAYKKLANKFHPDKNQGDSDAENKFKKIKKAYETLSSDRKRKQYDLEQENSYFNNSAGQGGFGGFNPFWKKGSNSASFDDIFKDFRGGRGHHFSKETTIENIEKDLDIEKAFLGGDEVIVHNGNKIKVKIPAKLKNKGKMRLKGKGSWGKDLVIQFNHSNSKTASIEGRNIVLIQYIDVFTMFTGGEAVVDYFDKRIKLTIKPQMQNCTRLAMPSIGFEDYKCFIEIRGLFPNNKKDMETHMTEAVKKLKGL